MSLQVPANARKLELRTSTIYMGSDNILYSISKPDAPVESTDEEIISDVDKLLEFTGGKKVCMVIDAAPNRPPVKKEQRQIISDQLNRVVRALAIISHSPLSNMVINLYFNFKPPAYPTKLFTNDEEAVKWVKEVCAEFK
jgi:hypothetical protein